MRVSGVLTSFGHKIPVYLPFIYIFNYSNLFPFFRSNVFGAPRESINWVKFIPLSGSVRRLNVFATVGREENRCLSCLYSKE